MSYGNSLETTETIRYATIQPTVLETLEEGKKSKNKTNKRKTEVNYL